ncbi:hypothetical protein A7K61_30100 [Pseudomonas sp. AP42]|nr:hypothetical protein A7K61_30100 [Pseudomonas sp. AP42]
MRNYRTTASDCNGDTSVFAAKPQNTVTLLTVNALNHLLEVSKDTLDIEGCIRFEFENDSAWCGFCEFGNTSCQSFRYYWFFH